MSFINKDTEIEILREGGKRLSRILNDVAGKVVPGISTGELDGIACEFVKKLGDRPSFLNYTPGSVGPPFPASLCISVNDEVVHGIPGEKVLKEGDIVGLDLGLEHKKLFVDMAITVPVGSISDKDNNLINDTRKALFMGIKAAKPGNRIGAIGNAIEKFANENNYGIVRELGGHGLGYKVHDEPFIPNFGSKDSGPALEAGMVLALEPMLSLGNGDIYVLDDGFTVKTKDKERSAHFEHTILITDKDPIILTE